jgi:hypothetical protein
VLAATRLSHPELWERGRDLDADVWPEYNRHGDVLNRFWSRLPEEFPSYQFVLYDEETDELLAEAHTIPCAWDGTAAGLPAGIDGLIADAFGLADRGRSADTLGVLAAEIPPRHQGRRLSGVVLDAMRGIAREHGLGQLIAPVRPNWKERYPLVPIDRYAAWETEGLPFDPWLRVHVRLGGALLRPEPESLLITGSVAEWEEWVELPFPETGNYVFPHGLATVAIDREAGVGRYWEPNVWVRHNAEPGA